MRALSSPMRSPTAGRPCLMIKPGGTTLKDLASNACVTVRSATRIDSKEISYSPNR